MEKEMVYEYIEESGKRELMELLDAVVNRFRELYDDRELIVITLEMGERRQKQLEQIVRILEMNG